MNLVAKEFCASRADDDGVLVLSEFAGVASELKCGTLLVNPYDVDGVAATLGRALEMSERERRVRMQRMRRYLARHDVYRWCQAFCSQLSPLRMHGNRTFLAEDSAQRRSVTAGAG
jgi:trehalose-6-phosphate synthase